MIERVVAPACADNRASFASGGLARWTTVQHMTLRPFVVLTALSLLAACGPGGSMSDGATDASSSAMDGASGFDGAQSRPDASAVDTGVLDVAENDGAMSAMTSRDCVNGSVSEWGVVTHVTATSPDGACPDRVAVVARAGGPVGCGDIEPCCDYFARCVFDVEFDVVQQGPGFQCPMPTRVELLGCRCLNNRVVCDPLRARCPDNLPAGYRCFAPTGADAFPRPLCSDCVSTRDAGADGAADSAADASRDGG